MEREVDKAMVTSCRMKNKKKGQTHARERQSVETLEKILYTLYAIVVVPCQSTLLTGLWCRNTAYIYDLYNSKAPVKGILCILTIESQKLITDRDFEVHFIQNESVQQLSFEIMNICYSIS